MNKSQIQQVKLRFGIIGNTEALARAIDIAIQVAPTDLSVLITGESGVGKESFPQIIHQYSRRKHATHRFLYSNTYFVCSKRWMSFCSMQYILAC